MKLMNMEKHKIKNKNKQNKYIISKPSFLKTSNTYQYFKEHESDNKNVNMTISITDSKIPINKNKLSTKNSKKNFNNFNNDENKENMKNKYNTNNGYIKNKKIINRAILVNKYYNLNSNKENININNTFKKIQILPKKKGRTLSSNINKILTEKLENENGIKTYQKKFYNDKSENFDIFDPNSKIFKNL